MFIKIINNNKIILLGCVEKKTLNCLLNPKYALHSLSCSSCSVVYFACKTFLDFLHKK